MTTSCSLPYWLLKAAVCYTTHTRCEDRIDYSTVSTPATEEWDNMIVVPALPQVYLKVTPAVKAGEHVGTYLPHPREPMHLISLMVHGRACQP